MTILTTQISFREMQSFDDVDLFMQLKECVQDAGIVVSTIQSQSVVAPRGRIHLYISCAIVPHQPDIGR